MKISTIFHFSFSIVLSGFFALLGYELALLTESGFYGAMLIGFCVFAGLKLRGALPLLFFFFSSNFWASLRKEKIEKRNIYQILANASLPALFSIFYYFTGDEFFFLLFLVSLGTMVSDTWSTEIGQIFSKRAFDIKNRKWRNAGFDGGISLYGIIGGVAGSIINGIFAQDIKNIFLISIFSFTGNIFDSLLGRFFERKRVCVICGEENIGALHCNTQTQWQGFYFFNNNYVNFFASVFSVLLFSIVYIFL